MEYKVDLPLIINGCQVHTFEDCAVIIEDLDGEMFCSQITLESEVRLPLSDTRKPCTILTHKDKEHSDLFEALSQQAIKECEEQFYSDVHEPEYLHGVRTLEWV